MEVDETNPHDDTMDVTMQNLATPTRTYSSAESTQEFSTPTGEDLGAIPKTPKRPTTVTIAPAKFIPPPRPLNPFSRKVIEFHNQRYHENLENLPQEKLTDMDHHLSKLAIALEDASKRATSAQHHNKIEIEATRKIEKKILLITSDVTCIQHKANQK